MDSYLNNFNSRARVPVISEHCEQITNGIWL